MQPVKSDHIGVLKRLGKIYSVFLATSEVTVEFELNNRLFIKPTSMKVLGRDSLSMFALSFLILLGGKMLEAFQFRKESLKSQISWKTHLNSIKPAGTKIIN